MANSSTSCCGSPISSVTLGLTLPKKQPTSTPSISPVSSRPSHKDHTSNRLLSQHHFLTSSFIDGVSWKPFQYICWRKKCLTCAISTQTNDACGQSSIFGDQKDSPGKRVTDQGSSIRIPASSIQILAKTTSTSAQTRRILS